MREGLLVALMADSLKLAPLAAGGPRVPYVRCAVVVGEVETCQNPTLFSSSSTISVGAT
jgi:hypothetical protein